MEGFQFAKTPHIHFGVKKIELLPKIILSYGKKIALVTGSRSFSKNPAFEHLTKEFRIHDISYHHIICGHEPSPKFIDESVLQLQKEGTNVIVSIGGGSVIDAGKAIAGMYKKGGSVKDYLEGVGSKQHDGQKIPFIAVPTTSGTGSEATKNAVISEIGDNGFKKSLRHDNFVPDVALVDPGLTLNCPSQITAACGMDAFTQVLEAFVSTKASVMTDSLAIEALKLFSKSLLPVCTYAPDDIEHRSNISYAALISGILLANAGLGTVHGFASPIGGRFDAPHGQVCGNLLYPVVKYTIQKLQATEPNCMALRKYAFTGRLFSEKVGASQHEYLNDFIEVLDKLAGTLQMPKLSEFGIQEEHLRAIAKSTGNKNNPYQFSEDELVDILQEQL